VALRAALAYKVQNNNAYMLRSIEFSYHLRLTETLATFATT